MIKILINSHSRTGMSYLINFMRVMYDKTRDIPFSNLNEFILWSHSSVTLLAKFEDIKQITIIRNPLDTIASLATKHNGGVGEEVHHGQIVYLNSHKDRHATENEYLDYELSLVISEYIPYLDNTIKNINNLIPFTFEQVTNSTHITLKNIQSLCGDFLMRLNEESIQEINNIFLNQWKIEDKKILGNKNNYMNRMPVDKKPEIYEKFKNRLIINNQYNSILSKYNETLNKIYDFQNTYSYKF